MARMCAFFFFFYPCQAESWQEAHDIVRLDNRVRETPQDSAASQISNSREPVTTYKPERTSRGHVTRLG